MNEDKMPLFLINGFLKAKIIDILRHKQMFFFMQIRILNNG